MIRARGPVMRIAAIGYIGKPYGPRGINNELKKITPTANTEAVKKYGLLVGINLWAFNNVLVTI